MLCYSIEWNVVWVLEILSKKLFKVKGNFLKFSFILDLVRLCLIWWMLFIIIWILWFKKKLVIFIVVIYVNLYFSFGGIKVFFLVLIVFI